MCYHVDLLASRANHAISYIVGYVAKAAKFDGKILINLSLKQSPKTPRSPWYLSAPHTIYTAPD